MADNLSQQPQSDRQIRLGVVNLYTAAKDTAVAAASGWTWLGVCEAQSLSFDFPFEVFEYVSGIPKTSKVTAIVGINGTIGATLDEYSAAGMDLAAGGAAMSKTYAATPAATTVAASGSTVNMVKVASATGYAVGMRIEVQTASGLEDTYIDSIANTTEFTVKPAFAGVPVATTGTVKAIKEYVKPIGGGAITKKAFKAVFTDTNLETATIYCPQVSSKAGYKPSFGDASANAKIPLELTAHGVEETIDGKTVSVVGRAYLGFPGVS